MRKLEICLSCALALGCGASAQPSRPTAAVEPSASQLLAEPAAPAASDPIEVAVASAHRPDKSRARDAYRHPRETLRIFGVQPNQRIIELWPGGGWYTEILAPLVREQGKLTAVVANGPYLQPYKDFLAARPDLYSHVALVEVTPPGALALGPDGSADVVLTFRNLHGWLANGYAEAMHSAIFRVLKPGGVYGLTEHRAKPGTSIEASGKSGYVTEDAAIALATAAGFVLEERSEVNANPKDTKDHPNGVWSLPPTLRGGDTDRDKFQAIGESDRMTLRFRKPAK
jgi:predicted methyltransferase